MDEFLFKEPRAQVNNYLKIPDIEGEAHIVISPSYHGADFSLSVSPAAYDESGPGIVHFTGSIGQGLDDPFS